MSEVIDLGLDLDITGKKSLERQISDKIEEIFGEYHGFTLSIKRSRYSCASG